MKHTEVKQIKQKLKTAILTQLKKRCMRYSFARVDLCDLRIQFRSLSCVQLFATPWTAACQASLSITNSQSIPKLMSIESVMPSHLILCRHLLLQPSIFPRFRVFSNESALRIRWPEYWSFSFNILPMNTQDWFPLGWTSWISLQSKGLKNCQRTSKNFCVCQYIYHRLPY